MRHKPTKARTTKSATSTPLLRCGKYHSGGPGYFLSMPSTAVVMAFTPVSMLGSGMGLK